jgi:hypothetical protein
MKISLAGSRQISYRMGVMIDIRLHRTIANLMKKYWAFRDSGVSKEKAREYGNVIHPCIVEGLSLS